VIFCCRAGIKQLFVFSVPSDSFFLLWAGISDALSPAAVLGLPNDLLDAVESL